MLFCCRQPALAGGWTRWSSEVPFSPYYFVIPSEYVLRASISHRRGDNSIKHLAEALSRLREGSNNRRNRGQMKNKPHKISMANLWIEDMRCFCHIMLTWDNYWAWSHRNTVGRKVGLLFFSIFFFFPFQKKRQFHSNWKHEVKREGPGTSPLPRIELQPCWIKPKGLMDLDKTQRSIHTSI